MRRSRRCHRCRRPKDRPAPHPQSRPERLQDRLASRLRSFPPGNHYLDLIVRTDSFDQFHPFRLALSGLGYELSLMMVNLDEALIDRGGTARGVQ